MRDPNRYRILIVPDGSARPARQFAMSARRLRWLKVSAAALGLCLVAVCALGVFGLRSAAVQRQANLQLDHRIEGLSSRVEHAEGSLERVQAYDAKIRALTRADEGVRPFGIGPLEDLEVLALQRSQQATLPDDEALRTGNDLEQRVDRLASAIDAEEVSLQEVRGYLVERDALLGAYPTIWPSDGWVTSHYGFRKSPLPGAQTFHTGIDIAAPYGTPVRAAADGVVISSAYREAYGYTVEIDHGFGMGTLYAHCSRLVVEEGDLVSRGDIIASIGSTGRATGPHLHYEVQRDGVPVNPKHYMLGTPEPATAAPEIE